jgi:hypothetical protein
VAFGAKRWLCSWQAVYPGAGAAATRGVLFLADARNRFINAKNLAVDGGMTKLMIYHNDHGCTLHPPHAGAI